MAANITSIFEYFGQEKRAIVWAHNAHLRTAPFDIGIELKSPNPMPVKSMGEWLREQYENAYSPFVLTAYRVQTNWPSCPIPYPEFPVAAESIEAKLNELGLERVYIDANSQWFNNAEFCWTRDRERLIPKEAFRGLFFFE